MLTSVHRDRHVDVWPTRHIRTRGIHAYQATLGRVDIVYPDAKRKGEYTPIRPHWEALMSVHRDTDILTSGHPDTYGHGEYTPNKPCKEVLTLSIQTKREMKNTRQSVRVTNCFHRLFRRKEKWRMHANQAMLRNVYTAYPDRKINWEYTQIRSR